MPFLTSCVLSKFDQPLVNAAKAAKAEELPKSSAPVQGMANTKVASVGGAGKPGLGHTTTSRTNFAEAFPFLYGKQEYHLAQLRKHIPVHRSGKLDGILLPVTYAAGFVLLIYTGYLYGELIKKS